MKSSGPQTSLIEWASPLDSEDDECSFEDPAIYQSTIGSQHSNEPLEPWQLAMLLENEQQKTTRLQTQVTNLTERITVLQQENRVLAEELNELHSTSQIQESEDVLALRYRLVQLEAELSEYSHYTRSLKQELGKLSKQNNTLQCRVNSDILAASTYTENVETSYKPTEDLSAMIPHILDLLEVENPNSILTAIATLKRSKKSAVLLHKLSNLMTQCTGQTGDQPSASHVWKWIRCVVEDLVKCERFLSKTQNALGVSSHQEIEHGLAYVLAEGKQLRRLVTLVKEYFGLGIDISDQEIEWLLVGNADSSDVHNWTSSINTTTELN